MKDHATALLSQPYNSDFFFHWSILLLCYSRSNFFYSLACCFSLQFPFLREAVNGGSKGDVRLCIPRAEIICDNTIKIQKHVRILEQVSESCLISKFFKRFNRMHVSMFLSEGVVRYAFFRLCVDALPAVHSPDRLYVYTSRYFFAEHMLNRLLRGLKVFIGIFNYYNFYLVVRCL